MYSVINDAYLFPVPKLARRSLLRTGVNLEGIRSRRNDVRGEPPIGSIYYLGRYLVSTPY